MSSESSAVELHLINVKPKGAELVGRDTVMGLLAPAGQSGGIW
jgi:hypothetical protein